MLMLGLIAQRIWAGLLTAAGRVGRSSSRSPRCCRATRRRSSSARTPRPRRWPRCARQMGLDLPAHERYLRWLGGLLSGDPGRVVGQPAAGRRADRQPAAELAAAGGASPPRSPVPIALLLGIAAAVWRGSLVRPRRHVTGACRGGLGAGVPGGDAGVLVFAVQLRWLPALSYVSDIDSFGQLLQRFAMPVLTLCCVIVAQMMRMTRAAVIDQLEAPYIEMVRLKGASPAAHGAARTRCRNAVGPDRQRGGAEPVVPAGRRDHRRDDLQLPRHRQADGRRRVAARHAAGAGLRHDLLRGLSAAGDWSPTSAASSPTRGCGTDERHRSITVSRHRPPRRLARARQLGVPADRPGRLASGRRGRVRSVPGAAIARATWSTAACSRR